MMVDACPAAADSRSVRQCGDPVRVCHSILLFSDVRSARRTCTRRQYLEFDFYSRNLSIECFHLLFEELTDSILST